MKEQKAIRAMASLARSALAESIRLASKVSVDEQKARVRVERAETLVADAIEAHDIAAKALVDAQAGHADRLAASLDDGAAPISATGALRQARAKEADAADDIEAARSALEKLLAAQEASEEVARDAKTRLIWAVDLVLTDELHRMVAEAEAMQAELGRRRAAIHEVYSHLARDSFERVRRGEERTARDGELVDLVNAYLARPAFPMDARHARENSPAVLEWRRAAEALAVDAAAALPGR